MRKTFTKEEIKTLRASTPVLKCTSKQIMFTENFKKAALRMHEKGLMPMEIFQEAGLNINLIGRRTPKLCIYDWRKQIRAKGSLKDNRGRGGKKPKEKIPKNEKERIKYLEAKIAYLEKENDFLAKLRAKRKEE